MALQSYIQRMKFVDYLIRKRATGNLSNLARKLNLSKSQTGAFLKEMKEEGFPIEYSRKLGNYCYTSRGKLVSQLFEKETFEEEQLSQSTLRKVSGGEALFNFYVHSDYIGMSSSNFVK